MEFIETDFELNVFETNPCVLIRSYFESMRNEICLYEEASFKRNNSYIDFTKRSESADMSLKRDRILQEIHLAETKCLSARNERQLIKLTNQLKEIMTKSMQISRRFFNTECKTADIEHAEDLINQELFEIKKELFLNRTIFFVRGFYSEFMGRKFGTLIILDFSIKEDQVSFLK